MMVRRGTVFGLWTVRGGPYRDEKRRPRYWCICSCGKRKQVLADNLIRGVSNGCGHDRPAGVKPRRFTRMERVVRDLFSVNRSAAKKRGYSWSLTVDDCSRIFLSPCFYCGAKPSKAYVLKDGRRGCYNGIDRVNNDVGYEPGNVVPCCSPCNYAKRTMPFRSWRAWVRRLADHFHATGGWRK